MLILSRHDVEQVLTMPDAIAAVADAFRQLAAGAVTMPQRLATPVTPYNGIHLAMPAFVAGEPGALAIKVVTVFNDNPQRGEPTIQGVVLVHDPQTGKPLALMDAEHLTAMRTGAASGVATQHLARPDAATATIFGAGAQAITQLEALCAVRPIRRAFVFSREGADAYAARMSTRLGIPVTVTTDTRAAVEAADVICTATNSTTPLFDGAWLRPGAHINAIGAYQRTMRELDTTTMLRSRVFVDGRQAALAEAGEIMIPYATGDYTPEQVAGEIGDVLLGRIAGRTTPEEITVFKTVGMAVQDAVTAPLVLRLALERGLGTRVEM